MNATHTLTLRPIDEYHPVSRDGRDSTVVVERATPSGWYARPISNPACPTLFYPRFAWYAVEVAA